MCLYITAATADCCLGSSCFVVTSQWHAALRSACGMERVLRIFWQLYRQNTHLIIRKWAIATSTRIAIGRGTIPMVLRKLKRAPVCQELFRTRTLIIPQMVRKFLSNFSYIIFQKKNYHKKKIIKINNTLL